MSKESRKVEVREVLRRQRSRPDEQLFLVVSSMSYKVISLILLWEFVLSCYFLHLFYMFVVDTSHGSLSHSCVTSCGNRL